MQLQLLFHGIFYGWGLSISDYRYDRAFLEQKGTVTGIVATAAGLAAILLPLATGLMSKTGHISIIFIFDAMLSVVGMAAAALLITATAKF